MAGQSQGEQHALDFMKLCLQSYNYSVRYRPEVTDGNADALGLCVKTWGEVWRTHEGLGRTDTHEFVSYYVISYNFLCDIAHVNACVDTCIDWATKVTLFSFPFLCCLIFYLCSHCYSVANHLHNSTVTGHQITRYYNPIVFTCIIVPVFNSSIVKPDTHKYLPHTQLPSSQSLLLHHELDQTG